ncbi:hypothetical protein [Longibacter salinarum]|nr:hypothetical protein [Longibacter salinarum]
MTSSKQYAPRRAFSSSVRYMQDHGKKRELNPSVDLLPDELLPGMMASRDARRHSMQNKAILTSLIGLALVVIIAVSSAFALTEPTPEPFAVESDAEVVTMQDLPTS